MPKTSAGGRVLDPASRRELIVDAAERAFGERGIAQTTVSDVARAAGVTRGLVYHYFPTVDGLVTAVLDRIVAGFVADVAAWDESRQVGHIDQAVRDVVAMLRVRVRPPGPVRLDLRDPANAVAYQGFVDHAVEAVVNRLESTTIRAYAARHAIAIERVRDTFVVLVHGLIGLVRTHPDVDDEALATIVRQVLRLAPDDGAEPAAAECGTAGTGL